MNYVLSHIRIANEHYRELKQLDFVLVIDLPQGAVTALLKPENKQLIFYHRARLCEKRSFFALLHTETQCLGIKNIAHPANAWVLQAVFPFLPLLWSVRRCEIGFVRLCFRAGRGASYRHNPFLQRSLRQLWPKLALFFSNRTLSIPLVSSFGFSASDFRPKAGELALFFQIVVQLSLYFLVMLSRQAKHLA
jgi:hypothetical protein